MLCPEALPIAVMGKVSTGASMKIYLDHNATSPLRPQALEAMLAFLRCERGNPSSSHTLGRQERMAVEDARAEIARLLRVRPSEVIFTSGGTESNVLAILGLAWATRKRTVVTTPVEHSSVLRPVEFLARSGWTVRTLPVDRQGRVSPSDLRCSLTEDTALVTIGWANHEIGVCQPIEELGALCRERGVPFHSDAVQAIGRVPVDGGMADLLSASAHKFGGPAGVGFLIVRRGVSLVPVLWGGGQERGMRSGTENVPGIVGCAAALRAALTELADTARHCQSLRERLWAALEDLPGVTRYSGLGPDVLPNTLCLGFDGVPGDALVARLDLEGVCASVGSACASGAADPSHVLLALGVKPEAARNAVRLSLGAENTRDEIDRAAEIIRRVILSFRSHGCGRNEQWQLS